MTDRHCDPAALWEAARQARKHDRATQEHLSTCEECSSLWEIIRAFPGARAVRLAHAPSAWVEQAIALAGARSLAGRLRKLAATLQFDSWLSPSPAVLRGAAGGISRRLGWEVESWSIDLRAEKVVSGWNFTALVEAGGEPAAGVVIKAGSTSLRTDHAGLATWTAAKPPKSLRVSDDVRSAQLGPLIWQLPKRN